MLQSILGHRMADSGQKSDAGVEGGDPDAEVDPDDEAPGEKPGYLPTLPETFVTLGAGCLATAALLTTVAFSYVVWMAVSGNTRGLADYQVILAGLQMAFATVLLVVGTHSALKRVRWTLAMLAAIMGSFAVITIPFTVVAVVCIGLGRYHFSHNMLE